MARNLREGDRGQLEAFFFEPYFIVHNVTQATLRKPRTTVTVDFALGVALRLAKAGYWQGDPGRVLKAPAEQVVAAAQYENFLSDMEHMIVELNKKP